MVANVGMVHHGLLANVARNTQVNVSFIEVNIVFVNLQSKAKIAVLTVIWRLVGDRVGGILFFGNPQTMHIY